MASIHSIRAGVLALARAVPFAATALHAQAPVPVSSSAQPSSFTIFIRAVPIGSEQVAVERTNEGWRITGSGRVAPPLDVVTRRFEVRYDADWKPLELTVDATVRGENASIHTTVAGTTATSEVSKGGAPAEKVDTINPASVLLPDTSFSAYEALAARVSSAPRGSVVHAYVVPQQVMSVTVGVASTERIQTLARLIEARRTKITLSMSELAPLEAEIWSDESGRLLRLSVPAQSLEVVREDIASVSARRVTVSRPGDQQARIAASGFSLAGTISVPEGAGAVRRPAVVLVGGSGLADRDETVAGIPVFGHLAGALADAGFLVLRYDRRGVGQSGGRPESATIADYADDVRAAVRHLGDRKDVDRRRVAVLAHSDGGPSAMIAAEKEDQIAALVLVGAIGMTGAEHNMAQVAHALERSSKSEIEKQTTMELQKRIQNAVLTGKGWEEIPVAFRRQADTMWFQSFLAFDPAKSMRNISQPVLVVHGALDRQVDPANADRLATLARARKGTTPVDVVKLAGINHLLVPATTGELDEYTLLADQRVSPVVAETITQWLQKTWKQAAR